MSSPLGPLDYNRVQLNRIARENEARRIAIQAEIDNRERARLIQIREQEERARRRSSNNDDERRPDPKQVIKEAHSKNEFDLYRSAKEDAASQGVEITKAIVRTRIDDDKIVSTISGIKGVSSGSRSQPEQQRPSEQIQEPVESVVFANPDHNLLFGSQRIGDILTKEIAKGESGLYGSRTIYEPDSVRRYLAESSAIARFNRQEGESDFPTLVPAQGLKGRFVQEGYQSLGSKVTVITQPPRIEKVSSSIEQFKPLPEGNTFEKSYQAASAWVGNQVNDFFSGSLGIGLGFEAIGNLATGKQGSDTVKRAEQVGREAIEQDRPEVEREFVGLGAQAVYDQATQGRTEAGKIAEQRASEYFKPENLAYSTTSLGLSALSYLNPISTVRKIAKIPELISTSLPSIPRINRPIVVRSTPLPYYTDLAFDQPRIQNLKESIFASEDVTLKYPNRLIEKESGIKTPITEADLPDMGYRITELPEPKPIRTIREIEKIDPQVLTMKRYVDTLDEFNKKYGSSLIEPEAGIKRPISESELSDFNINLELPGSVKSPSKLAKERIESDVPFELQEYRDYLKAQERIKPSDFDVITGKESKTPSEVQDVKDLIRDTWQDTTKPIRYRRESKPIYPKESEQESSQGLVTIKKQEELTKVDEPKQVKKRKTLEQQAGEISGISDSTLKQSEDVIAQGTPRTSSTMLISEVESRPLPPSVKDSEVYGFISKFVMPSSEVRQGLTVRPEVLIKPVEINSSLAKSNSIEKQIAEGLAKTSLSEKIILDQMLNTKTSQTEQSSTIQSSSQFQSESVIPKLQTDLFPKLRTTTETIRSTRYPPPEMPLIPTGFLEFPKPRRRKKGKTDYSERIWNLSSIEFLLHGKGFKIDPELY